MKKTVKTLLSSCAICVALSLSACSSGEKKTSREDVDGLLIVAEVNVWPEYRSELLEAFQALVDATRREQGNISYDLYEDISNLDHFTFVEMWKSQQAIDSHNASDHFRKFVETVQGKAEISVSVLKHKF